MSDSKYPRIGNSVNISDGICVMCGKDKANVRFHVEIDIIRGFERWDTLIINCKDHSSAFETFEVIEIKSWCNVVLTYTGGGS